MVTPHNETEEGNRDRTERNQAITEDRAMAVDSDDFADDSHGGQNHDVYGRVGVDPEKMLVQYWVTSSSWIVEAGVKVTVG